MFGWIKRPAARPTSKPTPAPKNIVVCGVVLPPPEDLGWTEGSYIATFGTNKLPLTTLKLGKISIQRPDWEARMPDGYTLNSPIHVNDNPVGRTSRDREEHNRYIKAVWDTHLTRTAAARPETAPLFARCDGDNDFVLVHGWRKEDLAAALPLLDARRLLADLTVAVQLLELPSTERDAARRLGLKPPEVG